MKPRDTPLLFNEHLSIQKKSYFDIKLKQRLKQTKTYHTDHHQTNFGISIKNTFLFVLLHLRKNQQTNNIIGINIPEICIFHQGTPYDIIYSDHGHIKSHKNIKLNEIYSFFQQRSKLRNTPKNEQSYACFQNNECLLLSDTDLLINCRKFKNDPFFKKLEYMKNGLSFIQINIEIAFDASIDCKYRGQAFEHFLGLRSEKEMLNKLGEYEYLKFCCEKIALFLNRQHNIRLIHCQFLFNRTVLNDYYLVDVRNINYINLTKSLLDREKRLKLKEQQRKKILNMTNEEYDTYKDKERNVMVTAMTSQMNSSFYSTTNKLNLSTNKQRVDEIEKTEKALQKLFPKFKEPIKEEINKFRYKTFYSKTHKLLTQTSVHKQKPVRTEASGRAKSMEARPSFRMTARSHFKFS